MAVRPAQACVWVRGGGIIFGANGLKKLQPVSQPNVCGSRGCDTPLAASCLMWVRDDPKAKGDSKL